MNVRGMSPKATSDCKWKRPFISDNFLNCNDTFVPYMCITETWLKSYVTDAQIDIVNYNVYRADRRFRKGGGALIYVHDSLLVSNEHKYDDGVCEAIMIHIDSIKTVVACVYRPPDSGTASFKKVMRQTQEYLDKADPSYDKILTGDYNLPNINWDTQTVRKTLGSETTECANILLNAVGSNFLSQVIEAPTRGYAILDLFLTSNDSTIAEISVSDTPLSDHDIIRLDLAFDARDKNQQTHVKDIDPLSFRALDIHNVNSESLDASLNDVDWDQMFVLCSQCYDNDDDCINAYSELVRLITLQLCLSVVPAKKIPTPGVPGKNRRSLYNRRRKLKSRLKSLKCVNPSSPNIAKLDRELNLLEINIRDAINDELEKREKKAVGSIKENPSYFFSYAKRFSKLKSNVGPLKDSQGNLKHQPEDMANILQGQYSSVFSDPESPDIDSSASHVEANDESSVTDIEITQELMIEAMNELDPKSSAPDGDIPAKILKSCRQALSQPLVILWQSSLDKGIIPDQLKRQYIAPIFKKGAKTDPANYRPVSLTSHVIKIFERVIRKQLVSFLETNNLISNKQHGFRKGRSCLTQLLGHFDNILQNHAKDIETDVIYLDYAKAFDKVDHAILLKKLSLYGVKGKLLEWLKQFLEHRTQVVVVDGEQSVPAPVISGVPQGTVLGPILFIMYLNDLENVLTEARSSSFADDTRMSQAISCVADTESLQTDLNSVIQWSIQNNMLVHEDKFELLCYHAKPSKLLRELPFADEYCQYQTPGGYTMLPKEIVKDLGVHLSADLSWSPHIAKMVASARHVAAWVLGVFRDRSKETMIPLYKSLIRCTLEYCCPVWDPTSIADIQLIEDVQRYFTDKISCCKDLNYWERLKLLKLQSLQRRRERYSIIHMWKLLNNIVPNDLNIVFRDRERQGIRAMIPPLQRGARQAAQTHLDNAFSIRAARLWNAIPPGVTRITDLEAFKTQLSVFLNSFPDNPPTSGYSAPNNNSLLAWTQAGDGGLR